MSILPITQMRGGRLLVKPIKPSLMVVSIELDIARYHPKSEEVASNGNVLTKNYEENRFETPDRGVPLETKGAGKHPSLESNAIEQVLSGNPFFLAKLNRTEKKFTENVIEKSRYKEEKGRILDRKKRMDREEEIDYERMRLSSVDQRKFNFDLVSEKQRIQSKIFREKRLKYFSEQQEQIADKKEYILEMQGRQTEWLNMRREDYYEKKPREIILTASGSAEIAAELPFTNSSKVFYALGIADKNNYIRYADQLEDHMDRMPNEVLYSQSMNAPMSAPVFATTEKEALQSYEDLGSSSVLQTLSKVRSKQLAEHAEQIAEHSTPNVPNDIAYNHFSFDKKGFFTDKKLKSITHDIIKNHEAEIRAHYDDIMPEAILYQISLKENADKVDDNKAGYKVSVHKEELSHSFVKHSQHSDSFKDLHSLAYTSREDVAVFKENLVADRFRENSKVQLFRLDKNDYIREQYWKEFDKIHDQSDLLWKIAKEKELPPSTNILYLDEILKADKDKILAAHDIQVQELFRSNLALKYDPELNAEDLS